MSAAGPFFVTPHAVNQYRARVNGRLSFEEALGRTNRTSLDFFSDRLAQLSSLIHLPPSSVGIGYLVHMALKGLFHDHAPKPFAVRQRTRNAGKIAVFGYSTKTARQLNDIADTYADPLVYGVCQWESLTTQPMPEKWTVGKRLEFEVTTCPFVRKHSDGPKFRKGAEVDVFLDRLYDPTKETPVNRNDVYVDWLKQRFDMQGGSNIDEAAVRNFQLCEISRRTQRGNGLERKNRRFRKPVATFRGVLSVTDSRLFSDLLRNGIGRHKAFGLGMVLV